LNCSNDGAAHGAVAPQALAESLICNDYFRAIVFHDIFVNSKRDVVTLACLEHGAPLRHKARPQKCNLLKKQRSRTVIIAVRIIFASIFALSTISPAFAAEEDTLLERETSMSTVSAVEQHVVSKHVRAHRATEARAYAPAGTPADEAIDFSIGSQR